MSVFLSSLRDNCNWEVNTVLPVTWALSKWLAKKGDYNHCASYWLPIWEPDFTFLPKQSNSAALFVDDSQRLHYNTVRRVRVKETTHEKSLLCSWAQETGRIYYKQEVKLLFLWGGYWDGDCSLRPRDLFNGYIICRHISQIFFTCVR